MSALKDMVEKLRKAVSGSDQLPPPAQPAFTWEPAAVAPPPAVPPKAEAIALPRPEKTPAAAPGRPTAVVGASIPADVADFAVVYEGAGVAAPAHGYGVDKVAGMLAHESLAGLDRPVKARAVLAALDAARVPIEDTIDDATLRAKALVAFEAAKELQLFDLQPRSKRRIGLLEEAVRSFETRKTAEIEELTREIGQAEQAVTRLRARARAEQERIHKAVLLFVEPLPARVIVMPAKPGAEAEAAPEAPKEKPVELRLVSPPEAAALAPEAGAAPQAEATADAAPPAPLEAKEGQAPIDSGGEKTGDGN